MYEIKYKEKENMRGSLDIQRQIIFSALNFVNSKKESIESVKVINIGYSKYEAIVYFKNNLPYKFSTKHYIQFIDFKDGDFKFGNSGLGPSYYYYHDKEYVYHIDGVSYSREQYFDILSIEDKKKFFLNPDNFVDD